MKVYLSREFKINMDSYESVVLQAGAGINHNDLGVSSEELLRMTPAHRDALFNRIAEYAAEKLDGIQLPSLEEVVPHSHRDSFTRKLGSKAPSTRRMRGINSGT